MNQVLPRQRRPDPACCQRATFDSSWYFTPTACRSSGVVARAAEVKDELVAVVEEALAVDRLVVADRQVVGQARRATPASAFSMAIDLIQ